MTRQGGPKRPGGPGRRGPGKGESGRRGPGAGGPGRRGARPGGRGRGPGAPSGRPGAPDRIGGPPRRGGPPRPGGRPRPGEARRPVRPAPTPPPPLSPPPGLRLAEIDELELVIEKLVAGGDGLGRHYGVPIFVPRTAPGDRVRVRLVERRPDYGRGEVVELLAAGAGRREAPCPHFVECGGCDLQHLEASAQVQLKVLAAAETLARIARVELPRPEVIAGAPWRYRIRTQLHTRRSGEGWEVGYYARGSRRLVPIRECRVLESRLEEAALALASRLGAEAPERVDLAVGEDGEVAAAPPQPGFEGRELHRTVAGFELAYDARCFFQGHVGLLETLVERAVGTATGELAFDLYGGVGLFALPLARHYRRVVTVEADRVAGRYARRNARLASPGEIEVVARAVESWIEGGLPADADRVLVDPPREGLAPAVRRALVERPPRRLTYVSCHAAALGRDLAALAPAFAVESLAFLDLFPQTGHLETVAQLVRRERAGGPGASGPAVSSSGGDAC